MPSVSGPADTMVNKLEMVFALKDLRDICAKSFICDISLILRTLFKYYYCPHFSGEAIQS